MKRRESIILSVVALLALSGCSDKSDSKTAENIEQEVVKTKEVNKKVEENITKSEKVKSPVIVKKDDIKLPNEPTDVKAPNKPTSPKAPTPPKKAKIVESDIIESSVPTPPTPPRVSRPPRKPTPTPPPRASRPPRVPTPANPVGYDKEIKESDIPKVVEAPKVTVTK